MTVLMTIMAGLRRCSQCDVIRWLSIALMVCGDTCDRRVSVITCVNMQTFPLSVAGGVWLRGSINSSFQSVVAVTHGLHFNLM